MQKLLSALLVVILACASPAALAANACTAKTGLNIAIYGAGTVVPVECVIDTTGTDVTLYTPATGYMAAIVGLQYQEATAHNIQFTNGTDAEFILERPASSATTQPMGATGIIYVGQPSAALKFQSSAAISGPMLFYVIQGKSFQLLGR